MHVALSAITIQAKRVILGLSGGADSVALLLILLDKGVEVIAAHANFHLRTEESQRDEEFVRRLCQKYGVTLFVKSFDTRREAHLHKESIEMAARRLRYDWFDELLQSQQADAICTAHHRDDNVETFLLNLIRGSGLQGLTGMDTNDAAEQPLRKPIVRPLLSISRDEILKFLEERKQTYVTDSSNNETIYLRNRIRHELLPYLESFNPHIRLTLSQTISRLREAHYFFQEALQSEKAQYISSEGDVFSIPIAVLRAHPARLTLMHEALQGLFPTEMQKQIAGLVEAQVGKFFQHNDMMCCRARHSIEWGRIDTPWFPIQECSIDAEKVKGRLFLRSLQKGDRFVPYGRRGSKLVSDFLSERGISLLRRRKARVLCDDECIVWLV